jgi:putative ABC transport system substrate-binding protein
VPDAEEKFTYRRLIVELAGQARRPTIDPSRVYRELRGLMAYSIDLAGLGRRVAAEIDQIAKGAKPTEIPFYQASKFELVINLKTAKVLGIEIPGSLLARADEVIE